MLAHHRTCVCYVLCLLFRLTIKKQNTHTHTHTIIYSEVQLLLSVSEYLCPLMLFFFPLFLEVSFFFFILATHCSAVASTNHTSPSPPKKRQNFSFYTFFIFKAAIQIPSIFFPLLFFIVIFSLFFFYLSHVIYNSNRLVFFFPLLKSSVY